MRNHLSKTELAGKTPLAEKLSMQEGSALRDKYILSSQRLSLHGKRYPQYKYIPSSQRLIYQEMQYSGRQTDVPLKCLFSREGGTLNDKNSVSSERLTFQGTQKKTKTKTKTESPLKDLLSKEGRTHKDKDGVSSQWLTFQGRQYSHRQRQSLFSKTYCPRKAELTKTKTESLL